MFGVPGTGLSVGGGGIIHTASMGRVRYSGGGGC